MALTKLEDWSETAADNIDVGGIGLSDSTQIDQLDNIEREHMAQVAKWLGNDTLASAATTDLGSVPGRYVVISGTTTITGLGTIKAGTIKYVKFSGVLTLTYNASSLILPGSADIKTVADDTAIFVSEGAGSWRCLAYERAANEGTYTPTGTAVANVDSVTPSLCFWSRAGRTVTVTGAVAVDFTAGAGTSSDFRLTLPVASNFAATTDAAGVGANGTTASSSPLFVNADITNDALFFRTYSPNTSSNTYSFTASYRVL